MEWLGNYNFKINEVHDFKIMAGYSYQKFNYEKLMANNRNFPSDAFMTNYLQGGDYEKVSGRLGMESQKTQEKTIAFLGRINYNWNDIFLFTGSLRHEGNSKFGVKLRFSYGVTGRSGFDRYISLAKYSGYGEYYSDQFGWLQGYGPGNNPN